MSRQLNPGLFGAANPGEPAPVAEIYDTLDLFDDSMIVAESLENLKKEFQKLNYETQEAQKNSSLRTDKLIQRLQFFEDRIGLIQKETHEKWDALSSKVRELGINESKTASLIERHNQIVQSFELRITQAQRLIENQSMQLSKQQEMIDDARRQIEKLKKL